MTIGTLFFIAFIIACPVGMMFMMRGGHSMGGGGGHTTGGGHDPNAAAREQHIAELERENAQLRGAAPRARVPELIGPRS
ncbi:MAG: hypothetical protein M3019_02530 [Candidatus Dormibacteraeota bacterium]|nr:hypothetical protein [Candidatus Dormibacteraeota bacterium]